MDRLPHLWYLFQNTKLQLKSIRRIFIIHQMQKDLSLLCFGYFNEAQIREKRSKYDKHYKIYILLSTVYNLFLLLSMEQCASLMIRPVLSVSSLANVSKYIPSKTCIISGFTFV